MTASHFRQTVVYVAVCTLAFMSAPIVAISSSWAQSPPPSGRGIVHGHVHDSAGRPLANATLYLQLRTEIGVPAASTQLAHTDSEGAYRFVALHDGAYTLRAEMKGYAAATFGPVTVAAKETKQIDLTLLSTIASEPRKDVPEKVATAQPTAPAPEFFDEPHFTVAGVTQASNAGGHGSDTVLRTAEALAKATVSLSNDAVSTESNAGSTSSPANLTLNESSLREAVARNPKAPALHHQLGDIEEKLGHSLEAVREYQRAAELDASEANLFDWGTELLAHRALEPATEVFTKGNRLFPKSVRMLVALGVTWYARGSYDQATYCLVSASDLAPDNPTPYLFLGKIQSVEPAPQKESAERLARFAQLQPDNPLANYYYAVSLWKQSVNAGDDPHTPELSSRVESLLTKAVHLNPKLGEAYLELGILYSQRADFSRAISAYQTAIEVSRESVSPQAEETLAQAHYRLARAYLQTDDKIKAQEELELHDNLVKKIKEDTEHDRREIQEFVISMQHKDAASPSQRP